MAILKAYLSEEERQVVRNSIINEFGEESLGKIHLAFEISRLITSSRAIDEEIVDIVSKKLSNEANRKVTSLRLTKSCYDKIDSISQKNNIPKIDVIRAILFLRNEDLSTDFNSSLPVNPQILNIIDVFRLWQDEKISEIGEYSKSAKEAYEKLGWQSESRCYDIINTLWMNKLLPLFAVSCSASNPERPLYKFSDNKNTVLLDTASKRASQPEYIYKISKEITSSELINYIDGISIHCGNSTEKKIKVYNELLNNKLFNEIPCYIYTVPNFCPVPKYFNQLKGIIASDSLYLMLEIIEECLFDNLLIDKYNNHIKKYNKSVDSNFTVAELNIELLKHFKGFFIKHREDFLLQDYYIIIDNTIIGLSDFSTQSLAHPIPTSYEEVAISIQTAISRINSRALRINS